MPQPSEECLCCKALWIEFTLCEDLTCADERKCARVDDYWQGEVPGSNKCGDDVCTSTCASVGDPNSPAVCVYNQWADADHTRYHFVGVKGDKGIAVYDDIEDKYRIVVLGVPDKVVRFQLKSDLELSQSEANACRLKCDGSEVDETILVRNRFNLWHGRTGYRGWAVRTADCPCSGTPTFDIIFLEAPARFIEFNLTEDMAYEADPGHGGSSVCQATASVQRYWGLAPNGVNPGTTVTVYDRQGLFKRSKSGAKGIAVYDERDREQAYNPNQASSPLGRYIVIECQSKAGFISFTLTQDRQATGPTHVTVNTWWGSQQDVQDPRATSPPDDVYFISGTFPHALSGANGIAALDVEEDKYRVIQCDQMILGFRAQLLATMCPGDNCAINQSTASKLTFFGFGQLPSPIPSTADNPFGLAGTAGDDILILWCEGAGSSGGWIVAQVKHKVVKVAVGLRYNNCKLELGMRKFSLMYCDDTIQWGCVDAESDPNGANYCVPLYSQQVVSDVSAVDATDEGSSGEAACKIVKTMNSVCLFDPPAESPTPVTVVQFTPIDVIVDVYDSGDAVKQVPQVIYVACIGEQGPSESVFGWTDCDEGSGSGSA